ncbi:rod-determining factor RdfA [Haloarcula onubensis]|uniref:Uncharacterized protein n=1 Tax=Haloarcula onubensis TaxID=2950539 RepID=A0ABU2FPP4_9EURY|nr:rod-determining factor RdfA [Halomicroarcula sp. S3CR25-11]MDS0282728.1 hypothetical protein [Halomicroarcula sp. S3CR25-11]
MAEDSTRSSGRTGKVARVLDAYDLTGLGDELVAHWTAEEDRMSLRELADYFNRQLLASLLEQHRVETLAGEVDNLYELLTDDEVTSGTRIQAENQLREYGVDVDALRSDFVTRQAIHTYLTKHRDAAYEAPDTGDVVERRLAELQRLQSRQRVVTEQTLSSLSNSDRLSIGTHQVLVSTRVQCADCGRQFDVADLLDRGACDCERP